MQHQIPADKLGPRADAITGAVEACVHCGFCLPTCPTYGVLEEEMDSPRGRIFLMKEALEGKMSVSEVGEYVDRCLGCVACETSCPSGVRYGELVTPFRALLERERRRPFGERFMRTLALRTLPYPGRFRLAVRIGGLSRFLRPLLPARLRAMLDLLPEALPSTRVLPEQQPAVGKRRARVAFLAGCAQQVLAPRINWATLRVLARNGVEVVVPRDQGCCGALALHTGEEKQAAALARRNLDKFPDDVDAIVTNAAGCGSGMHEYPLLFRSTPDEARARDFASRVQDVSAFLDALGIIPPPPLKTPRRVAYHDACHLSHAQSVRAAPRRLLGSIGGVELVTPVDWEICCGSAGIYNIEQPEIAEQLGEKKVGNLRATGAGAIATGNIGCMTQMETHLKRQRVEIPVYHTMELLDEAYGGGIP